MRAFDARLLSILRTETAMEHTLRTDPEERLRFAERTACGILEKRMGRKLNYNVAVTRRVRWGNMTLRSVLSSSRSFWKSCAEG